MPDAAQRIADDLTAAAADTPRLGEETVAATSQGLGDTRARVQTAVARLQAAREMAIERARDTARATNARVHASPWTAIGIAALAGLVLGLLSRASRDRPED